MTPQHNSCGSIVVVEDPFVSGFLRNVLQRKGYHVIPLDADAGVNLLRAADPNIGLLITNHPTIFAEFAERVPLLYIAAFPDPAAASPFRASRLLRKPFHPDQLLNCVQELLPAV
jgi:DNA-binding response OmpR family regulator